MKTTEKRVRANMMEVLEEHIYEEMVRHQVRHMLEESPDQLSEWGGFSKLKDALSKMSTSKIKDSVKSKAQAMVDKAKGKKDLQVPPKNKKMLEVALGALTQIQAEMVKSGLGLATSKKGKKNKHLKDDAGGYASKYQLAYISPAIIDKVFEPPKGPLAKLFGKKDAKPFKGF